MRTGGTARKASRWVLLVGLLAFAIWLTLDVLKPWARWLQVETSARAVAGQEFPVRIRLAPVIGAGRLSADLHARRTWREGSLVIGGASVGLATDQDEYTLGIRLPPNAPAGPVRVVIYISSTGRWRDRTHAALTEAFELGGVAPGERSATPPWVTRDVFEVGADFAAAGARSPGVRLATTALWLLSALVLWIRAGGERSGGFTSGRPAPGARRLAGGCLAAAVAAATNLGLHLGNAARGVALSLGAYDAREPTQQIATALVFAVGFAVIFAFVRIRAAWALRGALLAVVAFLGLVILEALSLHSVDLRLERVHFGVALVQWLDLSCAAAAVACSFQYTRS